MLTFSSTLRITGVVLLASVAFACGDSTTHEISESPFCSGMSPLNESCQYEIGGSRFWLISDHPQMPVEKPVQLKLISEQELSLQQSEIRGLSMYMGRIPVIWQRTDMNTWQTDVMLGACTDPDMVWELIIKKGSHSKRLPFQSVQY
ncbi:hypothetical protein CWE09_02885 [Aliidiomarina minuta]|uniref:C-type lysozyme inhibitor domain-containing protein n=1 Tax=Aliidiomarina minuta TaxID=880057 RepID=A0A432W6M9_9GAMM|nr:hypothetical protein [Aliidiomarina minuta]RUO25692.1 hypothetical protein CWE09_02885 [Aliidiomarina minuta]